VEREHEQGKRIGDVLREMGWEEVTFEGELRDAIAVSGWRGRGRRRFRRLLCDGAEVVVADSPKLFLRKLTIGAKSKIGEKQE
jgi:hypothetical protein